MRTLKLSLVAAFAAALALSTASRHGVSSQTTTEAPAAFDNLTNGFVGQADFDATKAAFEEVDVIADGLGPIYNAQSCAECHQNPVSGAISQIFELRAGHSGPDGNFVDPPGGSLIQARAINAQIQERVPDGSRIICSKDGSNMFVMGFDGGQYGEVAGGVSGVNLASFSPDGRKILF